MKNTTVASLKAKIVTKKPRKRENKNYVSFRSYRMPNRKLHRNCKKTQKIKKCHYGDISSQNRTEKYEKVRK